MARTEQGAVGARDLADAPGPAGLPNPAGTPDIAGPAGFAAWVRPHWPSMAHFAMRMCDRDWEDVLQETLAVAWRKRARFDERRGSARAWLLALTADQARKSRRRAAHTPDLAAVEDVAAEPQPQRDLDIEAALRCLTLRQRLAVELHYYLGLPVAEAAEVMDCSVGTVKSTLADARAHLRDELGDDFR
jgi:RNA polymerase sigma-70 factor (ECF subfamily)